VNYIDEIGVHVKENNIKGFQDILSKEDFDINSGYIGGRNILHILIESIYKRSYFSWSRC